MRSIHGFKAIRDGLDGRCVIAVALSQASHASLAAGRTPQVFVPLVFHGDTLGDAKSLRAVNQVCLSGARPDIQIKTLRDSS